MSDLTKLDLTFFSDYQDSQKKKILSLIENIVTNSEILVTTAHNPSLINILEQSFDYIGDIAILKKENIIIIDIKYSWTGYIIIIIIISILN